MSFKGALSGLRQFLATESSLEINFCPNFYGYVEKRFDKRAMVNFKSYDVTDGEMYYHNTYIH